MIMKKLCLLLLLLALCHTCTSKGGRGGGSRGGGFRGSSRGSYSYRSSSFRATNVRTWSTTQKAGALAIGAVFISRRMRMRYGSPSYYKSHDVRICQNIMKYPDFNGSTSSTYGWFLCPLEKEENSFCCGDTGKQYCCNYWDSPNAIGAYVGFALLGIGFVIFLIIVTVCCCMAYKRRKSSLPPPRPQPSIAYVSNPQTVNVGYQGYQGYQDKGMTPAQPPAYAYSNPAGPTVYDSQDQSSPYPKQQYGLYPQPNGAPA